MYKVAKGFFPQEQDVADAMSETVLDCFEKINTLKKPKYFKTWIIRILINNCNDMLRDSKRYTYNEDILMNIESDMSDRFEVFEFMSLMYSLDEKVRIVMILYYDQGFNTREIGKILDLSVNTVKSRLRIGREKSKQAYELMEDLL